jgi:LmbE family N-acetylglucosaminyl deacetylase
MTAGLVHRCAAAGAHGVQRRLRSSWRSVTVRAAIDDTALSARRSALVVAPHPDDESLGCGATIARKRAAGTRVRVVIVADGRYAQHRSSAISPPELARIRAQEAVEACSLLGVPPGEVHQLGFEDLHVHEHEVAVATALRRHLLDFRPEEVLVVSDLDHHRDHRAVNRALHRAAAMVPSPPTIREFPVWSWIDGPWIGLGDRRPISRSWHLLAEPAVALRRGRAETVSTAGYLATKRAAIDAHRTQVSAFTDEPEWATMDEALLAPLLAPVEVFLPSVRRRRG